MLRLLLNTNNSIHTNSNNNNINKNNNDNNNKEEGKLNIFDLYDSSLSNLGIPQPIWFAILPVFATCHIRTMRNVEP